MISARTTRIRSASRTLQDALFCNPALLELNSIGVAADRLIPVAQEFQTGSGRIDNLYVDPTGRLTIVETKLIKNPDAHRSVVAQLIGYAADLAQWDHDKLNREIAEQRGDRRDLDAIVRAHVADDVSLSRFQRRLGERLSTGDFELLIVGDRASDKAIRLSEAITAAPGLRFRLSLIDLEIYRDGDANWPWFLVPRVVEKIVDVERFVVRVEQVAGGTPRVSVAAAAPRGGSGDVDQGRGRIGDADSFFDSTDLPDGFGELFRDYSARWIAAGGSLSPTAKSFRWT